MAITATLEVRFRPDAVERAHEVLGTALETTRAFEGNLGVEVLVDADDPAHWLVVEQWESREHDTAYRAFRAGEGAITELGELLAAAPALTWFEAGRSS